MFATGDGQDFILILQITYKKHFTNVFFFFICYCSNAHNGKGAFYNEIILQVYVYVYIY